MHWKSPSFQQSLIGQIDDNDCVQVNAEQRDGVSQKCLWKEENSFGDVFVLFVNLNPGFPASKTSQNSSPSLNTVMPDYLEACHNME